MASADPLHTLKEYIESCWRCRAECQEAFFNHCLSIGGEHVAEDHVKLMTDCIQICQLAADFMTRESQFHTKVCSVCADICEACADSCEEIGGTEMNRCMEACRICAESCRALSDAGFLVEESVQTEMHSGN